MRLSNALPPVIAISESRDEQQQESAMTIERDWPDSGMSA